MELEEIKVRKIEMVVELVRASTSSHNEYIIVNLQQHQIK